MNESKNPSLTALLTFLLGPIGLLIVGMGAEAAVYFAVSIGLGLLLAATVIIASQSLVVGVVLMLVLVPVSIALPPLYGYYAAKRRNGEAIPFLRIDRRGPKVGSKQQAGLHEAMDLYLRTYGEEFLNIGYHYADFGDGVGDISLSSKVCLGRDSLGLRPQATITNIGYGKTEGRTYLTYVITDTREGVPNPTAQVSGIFIDASLPPFAITANTDATDPSFPARFHFTAAHEDTQARILAPKLESVMLSKPSGAGSLWSEGGWLLTDSIVNMPETLVATAGWEYLTHCIDALPETLSRDFGREESADSLVRSIIAPRDCQ